MKRVLSIFIVLLMVFGPFAQGIDVGPGVGIEPVEGGPPEAPSVEPPPDAGELLSNIDGFFTENRDLA